MLANVSHHARDRMQGRAFSPAVIDMIHTYGESRRRKGADVYFLDRAAREQLRDDLGPKEFARIEKALNAYIVMADETLVTCAHRVKKLKW